jgi:hypothetical protein
VFGTVNSFHTILMGVVIIRQPTFRRQGADNSSTACLAYSSTYLKVASLLMEKASPLTQLCCWVRENTNTPSLAGSTKCRVSCRRNFGRSVVCRSNVCSLYCRSNVGVDQISVDQMSVDEISPHLLMLASKSGSYQGVGTFKVLYSRVEFWANVKKISSVIY